MELDGDVTFHEVTIDDNGNAEDGKEVSIGSVTSQSDSGFTFQLNAIDKPYKMKYKTKLKDRVMSDSMEVKNNVTWNDETKEASADAHQVVGRKFAGNANYKEKTVEWSIYINEDSAAMKNVVVKDTLGTGLKLKGGADTFVISGVEDATIDVAKDGKSFTVSLGEID